MLIGAIAFCIYSQSWWDAAHLVYDIPAGLSTFAFVAQLVLEGIEGNLSAFWWYRAALLLAMTVVTSGRQYLGWGISGHLSCVLAIAMVQTADARLPRWERIAYWLPVPIVLGLRLGLLEYPGHTATWFGVAFGLLWGVPGLVLARRGVFPQRLAGQPH
jgi:hypothetical protein